jgi:hypothetical protein
MEAPEEQAGYGALASGAVGQVVAGVWEIPGGVSVTEGPPEWEIDNPETAVQVSCCDGEWSMTVLYWQDGNGLGDRRVPARDCRGSPWRDRAEAYDPRWKRTSRPASGRLARPQRSSARWPAASSGAASGKSVPGHEADARASEQTVLHPPIEERQVFDRRAERRISSARLARRLPPRYEPGTSCRRVIGTGPGRAPTSPRRCHPDGGGGSPGRGDPGAPA